jgi:hypothetical protein
MLSNLDHLPRQVETAPPELVNDTNLARIAGALRFIDNELNNYFTDSDTSHLTNALDTGLQNLHQALRRSFGYWQKGRDPEEVEADLDLRPERRHMPVLPGGCLRPPLPHAAVLAGRYRHPR